MLPGITPVMMMGGGGPEFEFLTTVSGSRSSSGTLTFSSTDLGDPAQNRHIIVAISSTTPGGVANISTSGHTIGGVSANVHSYQGLTEQGGDSRRINSLFIECIVPSGATGDISIEVTVGQFTSNISVFGEVFRLVNPPSSTPHDTNTGSTDTGNSTSANISVPEGGLGIAVGRIEGDGSAATVSGFSTLADSTGKQECKYETGLSADASKSISCSSNGSAPEGVVLSVLSWEFTG